MYAKLRLPPHIRSFSRCSFRQTAILGGSDDRIEPNYFLYRDVIFFGRKKVVFRGFRLRLPPHFRSLSSCSSLQASTLIGSDDRIEPIYFQHKNRDFFAENKFVFFDVLGSPGFVRLLWAATDQTNGNIFYFFGGDKNGNPKIVTGTLPT